MRRKDREVTDINEIESIINKAEVCRIGLCENNIPYVVPMSFGYKDRCVYMHCAREGKKLDMIKANNNVCFEVDSDFKLIPGNTPSQCTNTYSSVIGFGKACIVEDADEKRMALDIIMEHYYGKQVLEYPDKAVEAVAIIKVELESMTGKRKLD